MSRASRSGRGLAARRATATRRRQLLLQHFFDQAPEGLFVCRADGRFVAANRALAELLSYGSVEELLSVNIKQDLFSPEGDGERLWTALRSQGSVRDFAVELKSKNGFRVPCLISARSERDPASALLQIQGLLKRLDRPRLGEEETSLRSPEADQAYRIQTDLNDRLIAASEQLASKNAELILTRQALERSLLETQQAKKKAEEIKLALERKASESTEELAILYELGRSLSYVVDEEKLFNHVFEALARSTRFEMAAAVWLDPEGSVRTSIRTTEVADAGLSRNLVKRLVEALRASGVSKIRYPESIAKLEGARRTAASAPAGSFPMAALLLDGAIGGYLGLALPGTEGLSSDGQRLFETIAAQASLSLERVRSLARAERSLVESTIASIRAGVMVVDREGRLKVANPAARKALSLLGNLDESGRLHLAGHAATELVKAVLSGRSESLSLEMAAPLKPGALYTVSISPVAGLTGEAAVFVIRDITGERQLHEQMLQTEKLSSLGELISGIAHELNNPLAAVLGYAELLLSSPMEDPESLRADIASIQREADRARRVVQNLLTFARKHRPEKTLISLNQVLSKTLELRAYDMRVNNIEVVTELDLSLPSILADGHQLQQVLLNIINNAHQAMLEAHGRGQLTVRTELVSREVDAVWVRPVDFIKVSISDDGPGIDPAHLRRIFDPFFTTKEPGKGTGLGLSISYGIVQEHGGRLYAESQRGQGATFYVELPVVEEEPAAEQADSEPGAVAAPPELRRVLVVDDEQTITDFLSKLLSQRATAVDRAANGEEALALMEREDYDLVISDIKMPAMDGREFYRAVGRRWPERLSRLIFISGDTISPDTDRFFNETGVAHLGKPFSVEELLEVINRNLRRSHAH